MKNNITPYIKEQWRGGSSLGSPPACQEIPLSELTEIFTNIRRHSRLYGFNQYYKPKEITDNIINIHLTFVRNLLSVIPLIYNKYEAEKNCCHIFYTFSASLDKAMKIIGNNISSSDYRKRMAIGFAAMILLLAAKNEPKHLEQIRAKYMTKAKEYLKKYLAIEELPTEDTDLRFSQLAYELGQKPYLDRNSDRERYIVSVLEEIAQQYRDQVISLPEEPPEPTASIIGTGLRKRLNTRKGSDEEIKLSSEPSLDNVAEQLAI